MKTKSELKKYIANITTTIHQELHDLSGSVKEISIGATKERNNNITIKILKEYYNSLVNLVNSYLKKNDSIKQNNYTPPNMDLKNPIDPNLKIFFNQEKNETNLSLDTSYYSKKSNSDKDSKHNRSDKDRNIPDTTLNEQQKLSTNEDEESNYYSLGGDRYTDPDERYQ
jgi:DNA-directed RNA polymerase subunit L